MLNGASLFDVRGEPNRATEAIRPQAMLHTARVASQLSLLFVIDYEIIEL